jgi:hypothetical protein
MTTETVTVTQADRDAVADFVTAMGYGGAIADNYRAGKSDHCFRIQAFARHRLASQSLSSDIEAAVEALKLARPIVEADLHAAIDHCDADWEGMSRTALEAIDAALKETPNVG